MGLVSLVIIIANIIFSYKGFKDRAFYERYSFEVEKVLLYKQYRRLLTAGFLHVNWPHLLFNMFSLLLFSMTVEQYLGPLFYLLIYFASLLGGNLFTLYLHRNHGEYGTVGASGAVCGIIFAAIALFPGMGIGLFFIPVSIPSWIYGLVYVAYSIYGIRSRKDNVGHEAHLAGALIGMFIAIMIEPSSLVNNYLPILAILLPSLIFIYIIVTRPHVLLIDNFYFKKRNYYSIDHKYNAEKRDKQKEVDAILEKIHKKGMSSLTRQERETLSQYSKTVR
jgi:membrane associated rhomboid family serine protease